MGVLVGGWGGSLHLWWYGAANDVILSVARFCTFGEHNLKIYSKSLEYRICVSVYGGNHTVTHVVARIWALNTADRQEQAFAPDIPQTIYFFGR